MIFDAIFIVSSLHKEITFSSGKIEVWWTFLNFFKIIDLTIYYKSSVELKAAQKIREITAVTYANKIANLPIEKRLTYSKL